MEESQIDEVAQRLYDQFTDAIERWFRESRDYDKRLRGQTFYGGIRLATEVKPNGQSEYYAWPEVIAEDLGIPMQLKTVCIHKAKHDEDMPTLETIKELVERSWKNFLEGYPKYMEAL